MRVYEVTFCNGVRVRLFLAETFTDAVQEAEKWIKFPGSIPNYLVKGSVNIRNVRDLGQVNNKG